MDELARRGRSEAPPAEVVIVIQPSLINPVPVVALATASDPETFTQATENLNKPVRIDVLPINAESKAFPL